MTEELNYNEKMKWATVNHHVILKLINAYRKETRRLRVYLKARKDTIEILDGYHNEALKRNKELQAEILDLRGQVAMWQDKWTETKRLFDMMDKIKEELREENARLTEEFKIERGLRMAAQDEVARLTEEFESEHGIRKSLESHVTSLGIEVARFTQQNKELQSQIARYIFEHVK